MGMEDMLKRIDEEAEKEAASIMEEARQESRLIMERERDELSGKLREMSRKMEREIRSVRNVHISDGKRKSRQFLLKAKEDLIVEAISVVKNRLSSLDGNELEAYLTPLHERALDILGNDMKVYPVRERDASVLDGKSETGPIIDGGKEIPSSVSRFRGKELIGGFVATTSDGSRVVNMTFLGILDKEEDRIREMIASTLFQE